jgi:dolichol-phosphate mannosyltransferase
MIVVVLPAYNEAAALPRLLQRMQETTARLNQPLAVVVVDDGSTDGTAEAARRWTGAMRVDLVQHARNRGLHAALDSGFRAALAIAGDGDWILTMDADDTHPPDLIPKMLARAEQGAEVVIASRFQSGAEWHGLKWDRVLFSYGVSWMFRAAWPLRHVRDYTCGYRLYRASLVRRAYDLFGSGFVNEPSFACMPDVLWKVSRLKPKFAEVPLSLHYDRKPGASKMNVSRTIKRTLVLIAKRRFGSVR